MYFHPLHMGERETLPGLLFNEKILWLLSSAPTPSFSSPSPSPHLVQTPARRRWVRASCRHRVWATQGHRTLLSGHHKARPKSHRGPGRPPQGPLASRPGQFPEEVDRLVVLREMHVTEGGGEGRRAGKGGGRAAGESGVAVQWEPSAPIRCSGSARWR